MSAGHELPESFILKWMEKYEGKVDALEQLNSDEIIAERKRNAAVFSDAQTDRIDAQIARAVLALLGSDALAARITKEVTFIAGSAALRFWVCVGGAFIAGAIATATGFWLKGH